MLQQREYKRGQIYIVNLPEGKGSIQSRTRPCVLISNNLANHYSQVLHVCPVTTATLKSKLPTHIGISKKNGLLKDSIALCEQVMLVTKDSLINFAGCCDEDTMKRIDRGIAIQFGLLTNLERIKNNYA